jgi:hypothetical protein
MWSLGYNESEVFWGAPAFHLSECFFAFRSVLVQWVSFSETFTENHERSIWFDDWPVL